MERGDSIMLRSKEEIKQEKKQKWIMNVQNAITSLLLIICSQSLIFAHTHHWPFIAVIGLIVLTIASIGITAYFIYKQDAINFRKRQYFLMDIRPTFQKGINLFNLFLSMSICLLTNAIVFYLFPVTESAYNVQEISKAFSTTLSPIANNLLYIFIYAALIPIVEELIFRQILPMACPSRYTFFIVGLCFILLHAPNSWQQTLVLAVTTSLLIANRFRNGLFQSIVLHQVLNFIAMIELIQSIH